MTLCHLERPLPCRFRQSAALTTGLTACSVTLPGQPQFDPYQRHVGRRPAVAAAAVAVPRTASRPRRTARTGNGPDLTVKARSQPGQPGAQNPTICVQEFMLKTQPSASPNRRSGRSPSGTPVALRDRRWLCLPGGICLTCMAQWSPSMIAKAARAGGSAGIAGAVTARDAGKVPAWLPHR